MESKKLNANKYFLPINLQFFAEQDEGEVNGESATVEEPETKTEQETEKTFTQAELDDIIAKRIERMHKKYEGFDELKEKATQLEKEAEERRLAELSEKERAEELAKKYEQEKADLAKQLDDYRAQVEREKIHNAFIKTATSEEYKIKYVEDAMKLADLSVATVDEEGKVQGVDEIIQSLVENKPFLLGQQTKEPKTIGEATNQGAGNEVKTLESQLEEAKKNKDFSKVIEISNLIKQKLSK